jgi:hypothetical protein
MKRLLLILLVLLLPVAAGAQELLSGVSWSLAFPSGRASDFLEGETSFGGLGVDVRWFVTEHTTAGLYLGWNSWSVLTEETVLLTNGALSGTQVRHINMFPVMATVHEYFADRTAETRPYIGLQAGLTAINQRFDIGLVSIENYNWHFAVAPEAGILFNLDRNLFLRASGTYTYAFDSGETLAGADENTYSFWGVNIGLIWHQW